MDNYFCHISYGFFIYIWFFHDVSNGEIIEINNKKCIIRSVESLMQNGIVNKYNQGIPKIIHYVYKTVYIPSQYTAHVNKCITINNNSTFVLWTDFSVHMLMMKYFPKYFPIYSSYFKTTDESLKRSDLIRYFILYKFGGIYMNLDTSCSKSFDNVLFNESCIISTDVFEETQILFNMEYLLMNSLMACVTGHNFFRYLITKISKSTKENVLIDTGPIFLTEQFKLYKELHFPINIPQSLIIVSVANPYTFSPYTDFNLEKRCYYRIIGYWKKIGCSNLRQQNFTKHSFK